MEDLPNNRLSESRNMSRSPPLGRTGRIDSEWAESTQKHHDNASS